MDALTLLKEDHKEVMGMLEQLEKTSEKSAQKREQLFGKLVKELTVHEKIEQEIFYPAVQEKAKTKQLKELVIESYLEHKLVDDIKADIQGTPFESEEWGPKLKIMMENIKHHAMEEEEQNMFPKVRELFSKQELDDLGAQMAEMKETESAASPQPLRP
ncbi:hemerythrin domain-containing protein [soil metagenome]